MSSHTRPTIAEIDLKAIGFNFEGIRKRVGNGVTPMAVVKANAYGHGSVEVARYLSSKRCDYFGVAIPEEGAELRRHGIKAPIHVFTLVTREQAPLVTEFGLEPTVSSLLEAAVLDAEAKKGKKTIDVHLKIDTGMNRLGVKPDALKLFVKSFAKFSRLNVKGVFTHFAESDRQEKDFSRLQLRRFHHALDILHQLRIDPEKIHCANSAAILDLPETYFNMVRPGIILFGVYPSKETTESIPLKPAMTLRTRVALVKAIDHGESVSYGRRYIAAKRTTIATLPLGYADGIPRALTNKAACLIRGKRFPQVGTICMDQIMIDCGDEPVEAGDEAVLIGSQKRAVISAEEIAESLGTIAYEVFCDISYRVPRIYKS